jgi:hypothetical protein
MSLSNSGELVAHHLLGELDDFFISFPSEKLLIKVQYRHYANPWLPAGFIRTEIAVLICIARRNPALVLVLVSL